MRAALVAQGLARAGELWTAILPVSDPATDAQRMQWITACSTRVVLVPLPDPMTAIRGWLTYSAGRQIVASVQPLPARARLASPVCGEQVTQLLERRDFDLIYVLRLYLAGVAIPWFERTPRLSVILDVDEDDATVLYALADLQWNRGNPQVAAKTRIEAQAYDRFTSACLPWFGSIVTASTLESRRLREHHVLSNVATVPNAIPLMEKSFVAPSQDRPLKLVYVGNLDYLPNLDAAERLAIRILPAIRRRLPDAQLDLIGAGDEIKLARLATLPGVNVCGQVTDLKPFYRRADLTIVPLRAGGGSRLKILEAFANAIPVIATPEAIAGLEVCAGEALIVAETDEALTHAALRVATDATLAQRIVARALSFVAQYHDCEKVAEYLAEWVRGQQALRHRNTIIS
ncbi:MAG: glycosyltransferase [Gammaproteobacteria bacterium]|nr:glycosyltransferase [Gammaproteobacteria bacterium]